MKKTRKQVYESYGIEYDSKTGKILTPVGWNRELLKRGNTKTGTRVLTWSMNQTTCVCHCKGCYADSGRYKMANVIKSLAVNTEIAKEHMGFLERAIRAQLETMPDGTEIRIHAVGDFFSWEYVCMWHDIVRDFPAMWFWTYTKTDYESAFDDLQNGNIVRSMVDGAYNFGCCRHVMELYDRLVKRGKRVHICRCGIDDEQHCEGCHKCSESEYVLFVEHSTDYRAKEDPLYGELVELVESQSA